jgi:hypothetical protein
MLRRKAANPLATSPEPRWLKVSDQFGQAVSAARIEPRADLRVEPRRTAQSW